MRNGTEGSSTHEYAATYFDRPAVIAIRKEHAERISEQPQRNSSDFNAYLHGIGTRKENELRPILNAVFGTRLVHTENTYDAVDFRDHDQCILTVLWSCSSITL